MAPSFTYEQADRIVRLCLAFAGAEHIEADRWIFTAASSVDALEKNELLEAGVKQLYDFDCRADQAVATVFGTRLCEGHEKFVQLGDTELIMSQIVDPPVSHPAYFFSWLQMRLNSLRRLLQLNNEDPPTLATKWAEFAEATAPYFNLDLTQVAAHPTAARNLPGWYDTWYVLAQALYDQSAYIALQRSTMDMLQVPMPKYSRKPTLRAQRMRAQAQGFNVTIRLQQVQSIWPDADPSVLS